MEPVSKSSITRMREEYENTLRKDSTANLRKKFPDRPWIEEVNFAWITRKELEALLNDNNADGLRIYYGCHHESTDTDPRKDFLGLHNVILVATKDSVEPGNPTLRNSIDQLNEDAPGAKAPPPQNYTGSGGDAIPLCPPACP